MTATLPTRDYSLIGPESVRAEERGLAEGKWFQADVDPARMRELMERRDLRPLVDLVLWVGLIVGLGALGRGACAVAGGRSRRSLRTAPSPVEPPTRAGTRVGTAPRSAHRG